MNKINKILSVSLALLMAYSAFSVPTYAQSDDEFKYENSIGSESSDFITNDNPVGKDNTQGAESSYKHAIVDENSMSIDDTFEKTEVFLTLMPSYSIKVPKTVILSSSGSAQYDIGVKGDLAGTQKITIKPVDKTEDTDTIDFYMAEQGLSFDPKNDIIATIDQVKTTWTWSEVEEDNYSWLPAAGEIEAPDISAGSWMGTFNFSISVDILEPSDSKYFALYTSHGLMPITEEEAETPMTWRKIIANDFGAILNDLNQIIEDKGRYQISYYTSTIAYFMKMEENDPFIQAAKISDEEADKYFNANLLGPLKQQLGDTTSTNADELLKKYFGYSAHELAEKAIMYTSDLLLEEAYIDQEQYGISIYEALVINIINFQIGGMSDQEAIEFAQQHDREAFDAMFNETVLPGLQSIGEMHANATCANDIIKKVWDFTFDDLIKYAEEGIIPVTGNKVGAQGASKFKGNNTSTAFSFIVETAQNITFNVQTQANAIAGLDFEYNPTKKDLKWFKEITPELYYTIKIAHPSWSTYRVIAYAIFETYNPPVTDSSIISGLQSAANTSDAAFIEYFNSNILPHYAIDINSIEDLCYYNLGFTMEECIDFVDNGIWPSSLGIEHYQCGFGASGENYITRSFSKHFEPGTYTLYVSAARTNETNSNVLVEFPANISVSQVETKFKSNSGDLDPSLSNTQVIIHPDYSYYTYESYANYLMTNDTSYLVKNTSRKQLPSDLIIPNKLFGYTNNGIPNRLLYGYSELEYVYVPSTCQTIGEEAFENCSAKEIIFRGGNISNGKVFGSTPNTNIEIITLSNEQQNMPSFDSFTNLKSVLNVNDKITTIPDNAFRNCVNLSYVELSDKTKIIGSNAFYNCKNLSISIPSSVEIINEYAFYECDSIKEINLPNLKEYIGEYAFYNCDGIKDVYIGPSGTSYEVVNDQNIRTGTFMTAFTGCNNVENITIPCDFFAKPDSVAEKYCFGNKLKNITFIPGTNSTRLFIGAFVHEDAVVDIIIEEGITEICTGAFLYSPDSSYKAFNINSIIIPQSMDIIAYQAFKNANITNITFLTNNVPADSTAFDGCTGLTVHGNAGSSVETWAKYNDYTFVAI